MLVVKKHGAPPNVKLFGGCGLNALVFSQVGKAMTSNLEGKHEWEPVSVRPLLLLTNKKQLEAATNTIAKEKWVSTNRFQIFLKPPVGNCLLIWIQDSERVTDLKQAIWNTTSYPSHIQSLIHCGRSLQDSSTLRDYGICLASTIYLNL